MHSGLFILCILPSQTRFLNEALLSKCQLHLLSAFVLIWLIGVSEAGTHAEFKTSSIPSFDWVAVSPSTHLKWHECYTVDSPSSTRDSFQHAFSHPSASKSRSFHCARLSLPLDYPYNLWRKLTSPSSFPSLGLNSRCSNLSWPPSSWARWWLSWIMLRDPFLALLRIGYSFYVI
jgi:hypothetical protein